MFASLRALLTGIVDYAGLFPPAKLPLDQAIRNYARYRREADAWMLGRFVVPVGRLGELEPFSDEIALSDPPFAFSVLGQVVATADEFFATLPVDLRAIAAFLKRYGDRVTVDALEVRLPADFAKSRPLGTIPFARHIGAFLAPVPLRLFCEASGSPGQQLKQLNRWEVGQSVGFKLRCGGVEASAFPSSEHIAVLLRVCLDADVPFKATAGLHHPLPCFDPTLKVRMHGFINLFLAGVLAHARNLSPEQIVQILDDDRSEHFTFDEDGASWREVRASTEEIAIARRDAMLSFGSCSFDEPREDLRSLGWL